MIQKLFKELDNNTEMYFYIVFLDKKVFSFYWAENRKHGYRKVTKQSIENTARPHESNYRTNSTQNLQLISYNTMTRNATCNEEIFQLWWK